VQDLQDHLGAMTVSGSRDSLVVKHIEFVVERAACWQQPTLTVRRYPAGHEHPRSAFGASLKVGCQLSVVPETILKTGVHRAHNHTVLKRRKA
jgi:hypothetical protein